MMGPSNKKRYHIEIGFPKLLKIPTGTQPLQYLPHAIEEAKKDKYGDCSANLPQLLSLNQTKIFEIEAENRILKKIVCRTHYNDELDLILAISTEDFRNMVVKTVWLNKKSDVHLTLNRATYNSPEDF